MKILSLNVWGGMLHASLIDYLAAVNADVYCLQEVPRAVAARSDWLTYRDGAVELQQRSNLYRDIAAALPGHDGFFAPAMRGDLMDGDRPCRQEFGLATFIGRTSPSSDRRSISCTARFPRAASVPIAAPAMPTPFASTTYRPLTVVQFHGLREADGKDDTLRRDAQPEALIALINRLHRKEEGLVLCGDFNLLPDSRTFSALSCLGLTNLVTTRGFSDTRTSLYKKPGRYADYLLVNAEVPVAEFTFVETPEVSDHRALLLTIS